MDKYDTKIKTLQHRFEQRFYYSDKLEVYNDFINQSPLISVKASLIRKIRLCSKELPKKEHNLISLILDNTPIINICKKLHITSRTYYRKINQIIIKIRQIMSKKGAI